MSEEKELEVTDSFLRPEYLVNFIGQDRIKELLEVSIKAATLRKQSLDHILLFGPAGLGKTTLAHIIANELKSNIKIVSGPSIEKPGDLAAVLTVLRPGDVLFIDEIHRLPRNVEELLYSAMEDFFIDIIINKETETKSIKINLNPFTLIGATTRGGSLSTPLRDRFGLSLKLDFYNRDDIKKILQRTARLLSNELNDDAMELLASNSRFTPRLANRLLKRVSDYALVQNEKVITLEIANKVINSLGIVGDGLDDNDIKIFKVIIEQFNGGPIGLSNLATQLSEEQITIEDLYEPYLIKEGYLVRTGKGRMATKKAYTFLGISYPKRSEKFNENDRF